MATEERQRSSPDGDGGGENFEFHTGAEPPRETGVPDAIEFIDVYKSFGRNQVLRGLNMGLPEGKISMIIGPSGTGKIGAASSTSSGCCTPTQGDVIVHGQSVPNLHDDELFELRTEVRRAVPGRGPVRVDDACTTTSPSRCASTPTRARTRSRHRHPPPDRGRASADANEKMPNELSGGMRKRAGFARALVLEPDIVLFDEPDSGLDPVRTALLCELIQEIHAENGGCLRGDHPRHHERAPGRRATSSCCGSGRIVESGSRARTARSDNPFVRQFLSGESVGPLGME